MNIASNSKRPRLKPMSVSLRGETARPIRALARSQGMSVAAVLRLAIHQGVAGVEAKLGGAKS